MNENLTSFVRKLDKKCPKCGIGEMVISIKNVEVPAEGSLDR
jgi:hypothetical protein